MTETLTIGQLAERVGLRPSTLRYYEEQGLLAPAARSEAGYRLYAPEAEQTLRFIQRAQRLGFSLADIRVLLQGLREHDLNDETIVAIAEERFLAIERRLTELLVLRHEMELFLLDFRQSTAHHADLPSETLFDRLLARVCAGPPDRPLADSTLEWLFDRTRCTLATPDAQAILDALRGRHIHLWQEGDTYCILIVDHDPAIEAALRALVQLEAECRVHQPPRFAPHEEGYLFVAAGENAFIFARLFLALEQEATSAEERPAQGKD